MLWDDVSDRSDIENVGWVIVMFFAQISVFLLVSTMCALLQKGGGNFKRCMGLVCYRRWNMLGSN